MIWGGAWAKAGKKTQRLLAREKKTQLNNLEEKKAQLNNLEEKKSSTQQPGRKKKAQLNNLEEKKLNSTTWKKKKFIMNFVMGCDALNMDKHAFYILFRYK